MNFISISRIKEDCDKKEHEIEKNLFEKREEIKDMLEENHYKNNQIHKMKGLIEDLEGNLENKTY